MSAIYLHLLDFRKSSLIKLFYKGKTQYIVHNFLNRGLFLFSAMRSVNGSLREVYYIDTIRYLLYYRHVTFTGRLNTYGTCTDTLQDALIHTALYADATYIYNTDTVHLQGALIHTLLLHFIYIYIHILGYSHFLVYLILTLFIFFS